MALLSAFWSFQQSLQNRVPRVQVLLPLPSKNGLNTAFKPFFDMFLCTEHGLIFMFWCLFKASKCSTVANNSNVSVCYIIKIASIIRYWRGGLNLCKQLNVNYAEVISLSKKDGYYQCEHCGTKYTIEQAKN